MKSPVTMMVMSRLRALFILFISMVIAGQAVRHESGSN
jgi:hypothetical protein